VRRITRKIEADREAGARRGLLEELYSDFYSNRRKVYQINFMRGIFFGVGSVVGGTLVVTSVLAVLGILTDVPATIKHPVASFTTLWQSFLRYTRT